LLGGNAGLKESDIVLCWVGYTAWKKVNVKLPLCHILKMHKGHKGEIPSSLNLGIRFIFALEKEVAKRLGRQQSHSDI
jgi:hypothetical protein